MPKPKLTAAEKKLIKLEKRRLKKLAQIEKKKQIKRDQLNREVNYGEQTIRKYERNWREMLKNIAVPRMRQELEFAWHNFERVIDAKDFQISLLMDELRDAEDQYMHNFKNHLDGMDKLMQMFEDRLDELRRDFQQGVQDLQDMNARELDDIFNNTTTGTEYLKTMLHHLEMDRKEQDRTLRVEYFAKLDETNVKNQLAVQKLRAALELRFQNMCDLTTSFINDYNKHVKDRKKEYSDLKTQEDQMNILLGAQFRQIKSFQERIRGYRLQFGDMKQREGHALADKQSERLFFYNTYATLRTRMDNYQKFDNMQLVHLNANCNNTLGYFEGCIKKGEFILAIAAICRKLETQKEKILPFPLPTGSLALTKKYRNELDVEVKGVRKELEFFWQRVGEASACFYAIANEREFLEKQKEEFTERYEKYVDRMKNPQKFPFKVRRSRIPNIDAGRELVKYDVFKNGKI